MKKISLLFTFCLSFFNLFAQTNNDLLINHFEKMAEISEDELSDFMPIKEANMAIGFFFHFKEKKYVSSAAKAE